MTTDSITFLANNGAIGGGEVMLLNLAQESARLGIHVRVAGPSQFGDLSAACAERSISYLPIKGRSRRWYAANLAARAPRLPGALLWCNGLLPALATAGRQRRVVHLHQEALGGQSVALGLARRRALAVVVPSDFMSSRVPGALTLHNWTDDITVDRPTRQRDRLRIGFIGRLSTAKGVHHLAAAMRLLEQRTPGGFELVLAGDHRFVDPADARVVRQQLDQLPHVAELGWVDRTAFFSGIDIAVVPSVWAEPFGLVAAEAMAAAVPLVVTATGALPEIVGDDAFPPPAPPTPAGLAAAISALAQDRGVWKDVVERQRERWEALFSPEAGRRRLHTLLSSLGLSVTKENP